LSGRRDTGDVSVGLAVCLFLYMGAPFTCADVLRQMVFVDSSKIRRYLAAPGSDRRNGGFFLCGASQKLEQ
jgi:hypothetical protein